MPKCKEEKAEKTKQKKSIKYFRRFRRPGISHFPIGLISMVKRKERLNDTCNPEKGYQAGNEHKHFPLTDLGPGKTALCKYDADDKKDNRPHQLEKLQP